MVGGTGNDIYVVDSLADVVTESAGEGTDEVRVSAGSRTDFTQLYVLPDFVENLVGTSASGQGVYANVLDNVVTMGGGDDLIVLSDPADPLSAIGGNDSVNGGGGNDFIFFGGSFTNADQVDGGAGFDTFGLLGNYNVTFDANDLVSIEKLSVYSSGNAGNPFSYNLTTIDANVAAGQSLDVIALSLRTGEHLTFNGSAETDGRFNIRGGWDSDTLTGGAGSDQLYGNLGADTLRGGAGNDAFEYYAVGESTAAGRDMILDFTAGDYVNLYLIDADANAANGDTAFAFIGSAAFGNVAGQLRAVQDPVTMGQWLVEADINGDGIADLAIGLTVTDGHAITGNDFFL
jgi:Ca2+-binding RTX toxin-like protein